MANRNDVFPDLPGLRPTIPPDPDEIRDEAVRAEEHGSVTTGNDPVPRELTTNRFEWWLIALAAVLAILGIVVITLAF